MLHKIIHKLGIHHWELSSSLDAQVRRCYICSKKQWTFSIWSSTLLGNWVDGTYAGKWTDLPKSTAPDKYGMPYVKDGA